MLSVLINNTAIFLPRMCEQFQRFTQIRFFYNTLAREIVDSRTKCLRNVPPFLNYAHKRAGR